MSCSPSTSGLPFSKLAACFTTTHSPPPHICLIILVLSSNLVAVIGLLCLILTIPLAVPSNLISPSEIDRPFTPEDYTSIWTPRLLGQ
ncbi:hypothetical protein K443DRAFT_489876 [Laccaria amethystina LaAM-08-1]|uniref:Uncharacterized protein n=1 Tax=Laccaria amethystina LaAM-08-1 TaxID=1095629 RepID=A0A0C9WMS4_9AGAR|nr:hypothetical protein K443DRAFT_489876 [Laccaria amethystina LaAM-08-1]